MKKPKPKPKDDGGTGLTNDVALNVAAPGDLARRSSIVQGGGKRR